MLDAPPVPMQMLAEHAVTDILLTLHQELATVIILREIIFTLNSVYSIARLLIIKIVQRKDAKNVDSAV